MYMHTISNLYVLVYKNGMVCRGTAWDERDSYHAYLILYQERFLHFKIKTFHISILRHWHSNTKAFMFESESFDPRLTAEVFGPHVWRGLVVPDSILPQPVTTVLQVDILQLEIVEGTERRGRLQTESPEQQAHDVGALWRVCGETYTISAGQVVWVVKWVVIAVYYTVVITGQERLTTVRGGWGEGHRVVAIGWKTDKRKKLCYRQVKPIKYVIWSDVAMVTETRFSLGNPEF